MKNVMRVLCAVMVAALVASTVALAAKTHDVQGEIVSVDLDGKSLTFKNAEGKAVTAPILPEGLPSAKTVKAGDKVTLTCTDDDAGNHKGVSAVAKVTKT